MDSLLEENITSFNLSEFKIAMENPQIDIYLDKKVVLNGGIKEAFNSFFLLELMILKRDLYFVYIPLESLSVEN
jgi:hypothetical protein